MKDEPGAHKQGCHKTVHHFHTPITTNYVLRVVNKESNVRAVCSGVSQNTTTSPRSRQRGLSEVEIPPTKMPLGPTIQRVGSFIDQGFLTLTSRHGGRVHAAAFRFWGSAC
jgi:hypothetical protein